MINDFSASLAILLSNNSFSVECSKHSKKAAKTKQAKSHKRNVSSIYSSSSQSHVVSKKTMSDALAKSEKRAEKKDGVLGKKRSESNLQQPQLTKPTTHAPNVLKLHYQDGPADDIDKVSTS